jgi:hypothetical protein
MTDNILIERYWSMPNHKTFSIKPIKNLLKTKYENAGLCLGKKYNAAYWSNCKKEISRIIKPGGKVISFGWNSNGIGKKYGFKIIKIVLVAHGSIHNDTIATVEVKNGHK